jgi:hypothetical protein
MKTKMKRITITALAVAFLVTLDVPYATGKGSPFNRLGIASVECQCSFKVDASGASRRWVFRSEPRIRSVEREGPADGRLEAGDYIVAIDGKLIVTGEGGRRFSSIKAGEPVVITVRRDGRVLDERIVPRGVDSPFDGSAFADLQNDRLVDLSERIEELSRLAVDMERLKLDRLPELYSLEALEGVDSMMAGLNLRLGELEILNNMNVEGLEESLEDLERELATLQEATPAGSFGMGISFDGTVRRDDSDKAEWTFETPPVVTTVEFGSPAARAGLRTGDVLTEIDGVALDSREGGERFSRIEPGQSVEFTYERDDREHTVTMTAVDRPESRHRIGGLGWNLWRRDPAKFSMTLGGTRFEVRSEGSVRTETRDDDDVVVIETSDGTFELRRVRD